MDTTNKQPQPRPLPLFSAAKSRVDAGTGSLLDKFVVDNEPSFPDDTVWRKQLIEMINFCAGRIVVLDSHPLDDGDQLYYSGHDTFDEAAGER